MLSDSASESELEEYERTLAESTQGAEGKPEESLGTEHFPGCLASFGTVEPSSEATASP